MPLPAGTPAPDFTLKTLAHRRLVDVTLSDNFGKSNVVLLFFPAAFTNVCTKEMCGISGRLNDFAALDAKVYGISVDTAYAQAAWAEKENIMFPLLSDFRHEVTRAYEAVHEDLYGMGPSSGRASFVIDQDGVIRYSEQTGTLAELPDFAAIDAALNSLEAKPTSPGSAE
jgi:glutaredoxin-dependent peroxiredoxin